MPCDWQALGSFDQMKVLKLPTIDGKFDLPHRFPAREDRPKP
jgi:hypothetical protein